MLPSQIKMEEPRHGIIMYKANRVLQNIKNKGTLNRHFCLCHKTKPNHIANSSYISLTSRQSTTACVCYIRTMDEWHSIFIKSVREPFISLTLIFLCLWFWEINIYWARDVFWSRCGPASVLFRSHLDILTRVKQRGNHVPSHVPWQDRLLVLCVVCKKMTANQGKLKVRCKNWSLSCQIT